MGIVDTVEGIVGRLGIAESLFRTSGGGAYLFSSVFEVAWFLSNHRRPHSTLGQYVTKLALNSDLSLFNDISDKLFNSKDTWLASHRLIAFSI